MRSSFLVMAMRDFLFLVSLLLCSENPSRNIGIWVGEVAGGRGRKVGNTKYQRKKLDSFVYLRC